MLEIFMSHLRSLRYDLTLEDKMSLPDFLQSSEEIISIDVKGMEYVFLLASASYQAVVIWNKHTNLFVKTNLELLFEAESSFESLRSLAFDSYSDRIIGRTTHNKLMLFDRNFSILVCEELSSVLAVLPDNQLLRWCQMGGGIFLEKLTPIPEQKEVFQFKRFSENHLMASDCKGLTAVNLPNNQVAIYGFNKIPFITIYEIKNNTFNLVNSIEVTRRKPHEVEQKNERFLDYATSVAQLSLLPGGQLALCLAFNNEVELYYFTQSPEGIWQPVLMQHTNKIKQEGIKIGALPLPFCLFKEKRDECFVVFNLETNECIDKLLIHPSQVVSTENALYLYQGLNLQCVRRVNVDLINRLIEAKIAESVKNLSQELSYIGPCKLTSMTVNYAPSPRFAAAACILFSHPVSSDFDDFASGSESDEEKDEENEYVLIRRRTH
jgi:hypothetical protein